MEGLLASIPAGSPISIQEISLRIDVSHYLLEELLGIMNAQLEGLCGVITPARFPALRRVRLLVHLISEKDPQIVSHILGQNASIRRLIRHGILKLEII